MSTAPASNVHPTGTASTAATASDASAPATGGTTNPVKGALAAVHGLGETVRGTFNSAVDGAFNESGGVAKNNAVTGAGIDEMETGKFSSATKVREGAAPGSQAQRGL